MTIPTLCIRPDEYEDVRLFVPRREYEQAREVLKAFLDSRGGRRRLLVHGERGAGKSIGVRAAIASLEEERTDFFPLIVPGDRCTTVKHLITAIADALVEQVRRLFPRDRDLLKATAHLAEMVKIEEIARGRFHRLGTEIEGSLQQDWGLLEFIRLKLGIRGSLSEETGTEEEAKITFDDMTRMQLLARVLQRIARGQKQPLIFVDNLDQLSETISDPRTVSEFIKLLLNLGDVPSVVTVRSEFISADISKEHRTPILFGELPPTQLEAIVERRLEVGCPQAEALRRHGLPEIARRLAEATGNPSALLSWLDYLCWYTPLQPERYLEDLKGYIPTYYGTLPAEVEQVARWFLENKVKEAKRKTLRDALKLDDDELSTLERHGVLIPDDVTRPDEAKRYHLSPRLQFLKLVG